MPVVTDRPFFDELQIEDGIRRSHYTIATTPTRTFNTTIWKVAGAGCRYTPEWLTVTPDDPGSQRPLAGPADGGESHVVPLSSGCLVGPFVELTCRAQLDCTRASALGGKRTSGVPRLGMIDRPMEVCPDCGAVLLPREAPTHAYLGGSPSCWALYGEVLAREYSDPKYMKVHRLTVDAYAAQHPGRPERRTVQSINVHLAGLYLTIERELPEDFVRKVMGTLTEANDLRWLNPPSKLGSITIVNVAAASNSSQHEKMVNDWARCVWNAWEAHHAFVAETADAIASRL